MSVETFTFNGPHRREWRDIAKLLQRLGWHLEHGKGDHVKCYAPDGIGFTVLGGCDCRAVKKRLGQLRKLGVEV